MAAAVSETIFGFEVLLEKELGCGSFGTVLEAIRADSREIVAVKKITRIGSANFAKIAIREAVNFQKVLFQGFMSQCAIFLSCKNNNPLVICRIKLNLVTSEISL